MNEEPLSNKSRGRNVQKRKQTQSQSQSQRGKNSFGLVRIRPLTDTQREVFIAWEQDSNLVLHGAAGTGKTFISLYLSLKELFSSNSLYDRIVIIRSLVPTREVGFLPGTLEEKSAVYEIPYRNMVSDLFDGTQNQVDSAYQNLKDRDLIQFCSTSYLRGITLDNCIIIVDEFSNMNFHELDSVITRVGQDSKIVFCGDVSQSDLAKTNERDGILNFMQILARMEEFQSIEFGIADIVRSGLVKSYLTTKYVINQK
jgi:predicted ribonuclease YlaK|tara:strand:- start:256 stop:1023 length:768 start_codon:yes stop_codon:yes gene_type:complete